MDGGLEKKSANVEKNTVDESAEFDESVRDRVRQQLDMRLTFAQAVSEKLCVPLAEALNTHTDLHVRLFNKWPGDDERVDEEWREFAHKVESISDHEERVRLAAEEYLRHSDRRVDHTKDPYWPFRYDYKEKDRAIEIHFGKIRFEDEPGEGPGILSSERLAEQRKKLTDMFREIRGMYKENPPHIVRGASWLYNRESYRRLYPVAYTVHPVPRKGNFRGGGTWGQFTNKNGGIDPEVRSTFVEKLRTLDPSNLEAVFHNKTLMVSAPIEEFYKEYGIEP